MVDIEKAKIKLQELGWKVINVSYPYLLQKENVRVDLDQHLTKVYFKFFEYDAVVWIPIRERMKYTELVKKIEDVFEKIKNVNSLRW